ncbi:hypothetical protein AAX05_06190 [Moraxella bovoculi]|uniref:Uncharacterized protein n=2 Tax=Moraxella bovoculi TaxID=386891 RepID=A0AAC8PV77_9GAMM|nr:hypothetical protein AAX06_04765 [Moraxella bovoculi]AKG09814.1 hypothetical protein AAX05_06190 [Moraxella bovoculi]AKG11732.1 hypothetical protein AAX07_06745 [Moraxella bovoculi]AKG13699.1 hypothetical protein AAX11_06275 [Moraxella bovoculi]
MAAFGYLICGLENIKTDSIKMTLTSTNAEQAMSNPNLNTTDTNNASFDSLDIDNLDLDAMLGDFADVTVEGGFDADSAEDDCAGGACKI